MPNVRFLPILAIALLLPPAGALAQTAAGKPAAQPTTHPQCPARVLDVAPLGPDESFAAHTFLIAFETPGRDPGHMSGTVSLFSGDRRYDVKFGDIVAAGSIASALSDATPVAVRFQGPTTIDAAYLSALGGASGGPCDLAYVWTKPSHGVQGVFGTIISRFEDDLRKHAATMTPIAAPAPAIVPKPECAIPNKRPSVVTAAPADVNARRTATGFYIIETSLASTGSVVDSWLWGSAAQPDLGVAGPLVNEARSSKYAPATFRCRPVASVVFSEESFPVAPPPSK